MFKSTGLAKMFAGRMFVTSGLASWLYFRFDQTGITGLGQVL